MNGAFGGIKSYINSIKGRGDGVSFCDIRPNRLIYFLAYALELTLFSSRGFIISLGQSQYSIFGVGGWTVVYALHMIASLIFMLLWSKKFKPLVNISVIIMLLGYIPLIFLPDGTLRLIFAIIGYIGLGGAVTSARCGYAFAANNAERLLGMMIMFTANIAIRFVKSQFEYSPIVTHALPLVLLLGLAFCLLSFKEQDFEAKEVSSKADARGLYWAFALFIVYFAIDGYNAELVDSSFKSEYLILCIGMAVAGLLLFTLLKRFKLSTWHLWNFFFVFSIGMGVFALFAPQLGTQKPQYLFCGLSLMGWPLCIYTLGCAQRRFASYALLKKCTLIYVILSPLTTFANDFVESLFPNSLSTVAFVYVLIVVIALLMLSPFSYKFLFSVAWEADMYKRDMGPADLLEKTSDKFEGFDLTPRQREVATLLLAAKTRRQIAGELKLSESTVKMHTSDLYRKLNINSRSELFLLFGATDSQQRNGETNQ